MTMSDISNISNNNNTQHSPLALKMQAWQGDCELFAREVFAFRPTAQQSMIFKSVSKCNSKVRSEERRVGKECRL